MTARTFGHRQHAIEQTVPVDAHVQVRRFRAGVAEHGRDRRQRHRRAQQPGRGVVAQKPGPGLRRRSLRPCGTSRLSPGRSKRDRRAECAGPPSAGTRVIGRVGPLVQHVVGELGHHQRRSAAKSAGCASSAARSRSSVPRQSMSAKPQADDVAGSQARRQRQQGDRRVPGADRPRRARLHDQR